MKPFEVLLAQRPSFPLFHYTNANGLIGIMREGRIWASSALHMNDAKEFRYALDMILSRLRGRLKEANEAEATAYRYLIRDFDGDRFNFQAFVASFSAEGDLLSQWMSYSGGSDSGYSIGFAPSHFDKAIENGFALVPCVYEEARQIELVDAFIDAICEPDDATDEDEQLKKQRRAFLAVASLKHSGFVQEAEWRLVKTAFIGLGELTDARFRQGRNGLVPYVEASFTLSNDIFVPKSICIGPTSDMDAGTAAVSALLDSRGLLPFMGRRDVEVKQSLTPYRP